MSGGTGAPGMRPLPETVTALGQLGDLDPGTSLVDQLMEAGRRVEEVVPDMVGLSLTSVDHGVTFTLVASDATIALLDAMQYLGGGPCVRAVETGATLAMDHGSMDEADWLLFARGTAARGVRSTLSMPIREGDSVVGGINLYGGSRRAFDGHHEQLARALGAWAGGAVTNADLSFDTRAVATQAPTILRDARTVETAHGVLAASFGLSIDEARRRLSRAAARAELPPAVVAEMLTTLLTGHPG